MPENNTIVITQEQLKQIVEETIQQTLVRKQSKLVNEGYRPIKEVEQLYGCPRRTTLMLIEQHNLRIMSSKAEINKAGKKDYRHIWVHEDDFVNKFFVHKTYEQSLKIKTPYKK